MSFNPQLALSESGEVNIVWNSEKVNASSSVNIDGQNVTSNDNTTSIQPSIILKKVESNTNATSEVRIDNNNATATSTTKAPSSSSTPNPPLQDTIPQSVNANANPSVKAGQDQIIQLNDTTERQQGLTVSLNGSATDPENDSLVYRWSQIGGKLVGLNSSTSAQTQFSVPFASLASGNNTFSFELAANDSKNGVGKDITTVQILKNGISSPSALAAAGGNQPIPGSIQQTPSSSIGNPPNAEARATPAMANPGQQVSLSATRSSDKDGRISSHLWEQLSGDSVILQGKDKSVATFSAPNQDATLEFRLTVTDNQGQTDSTTIRVNVRGADATSDNGDIGPKSNDESEGSDAEEN